MISPISGPTIRGARGLLGWSVETLAEQAHVGSATILRIEHAAQDTYGQRKSVEKILHALEEGGVNFVKLDSGEYCISLEAHADKSSTPSIPDESDIVPSATETKPPSQT
ncbi:MAG: hypothetical protein ABJA60_02830 [Nitrosospira sp.]